MSAKYTSLILWVDLRYTKTKPVTGTLIKNLYHINVITTANNINDAILKYRPDIICFDYDLPDQVSLSIVSDVKCKHPSIPFIMLTDDHSIELAIWALRSRAWDYFVKPVIPDDITACIDTLLGKLSGNEEKRRDNFMLQPQVPSESRPYKNKANSLSTVSAVDYVRQNLSSKIAVENVAGRCGMSKSHFSRTFKKEHGVTFQEFLIQQRMNKAVELLKHSDFMVTQVALAVGYCELSNLTSTFQRMVGMCPSGYRKELMSK